MTLNQASEVSFNFLISIVISLIAVSFKRDFLNQDLIFSLFSLNQHNDNDLGSA